MVRPAQPAGQLWHLPLLLVLIAACSGARGAADVPAGLARVPPTPLPTDRPAPLLLDDIRLPPGFSISLYVDESDVSEGTRAWLRASMPACVAAAWRWLPPRPIAPAPRQLGVAIAAADGPASH